MVVTTRDRQPGQTGAMGLHIGETNVREYFSTPRASDRSWSWITSELPVF